MGHPLDIRLNDSLDRLYTTFAPYRIGDDFSGCDCCVGPEHSQRLAAGALPELTFEDLEGYSWKALTTWGNARHFKHFLPRLLELSIEHRDDFLDLAVVFGKIADAGFTTWSPREQDTVIGFFDAYWQYQLSQSIVGSFEVSADTVLCAMSRALPSVQRFLDAWLEARTGHARRHLAAWILQNNGTLLKSQRLKSPFWDTQANTHQEVLAWLQADAVIEYLMAGQDALQFGDFSFAIPQLKSIRAGLAKGR